MPATHLQLIDEIDATPLEDIGAENGAVPESTVSVTLTRYQLLAQKFLADLAEITAALPSVEETRAVPAAFVHSHQNVPMAFLGTAVAGIDQTPELQGITTMTVDEGRDTLQYIEAFRPVLDQVTAFGDSLRFSMACRKALLVAEAQRVYYVAKGLARGSYKPHIAALVHNLRRDFGRRRGPAKKRQSA
jgi:hypothetical protein